MSFFSCLQTSEQEPPCCGLAHRSGRREARRPLPFLTVRLPSLVGDAYQVPFVQIVTK